MNEQQLRCFLTTLDCGGAGRAATRLFLTQPTVTYQIKSLERELGVELFTRTQTGLVATSAGHALEAPAREALAAIDAGRQAVARSSHPEGRAVRVCHCQSIHDPLYGGFAAGFSARHPNVGVTTTLGLLSDEMDWPEADVFITPAKVSQGFYPPRTHCEVLYEAWTYAIMDAAHPLASHAWVSIEDCQPYVLSFPSKDFMDRCDNWYWPYIHSRLDVYKPDYRPERTVHDMQLGLFGTQRVFFSRGVHTDLAPGLVQIPFTPETPRLRTMICTRDDDADWVHTFVSEMRAHYRAHADAFVPAGA